MPFFEVKPDRKVPLEERRDCQQIPHILRNVKAHYRLHSSPLVPTYSQSHTARSLPSYIFKKFFKINLSKSFLLLQSH